MKSAVSGCAGVLLPLLLFATVGTVNALLWIGERRLYARRAGR